MPNPSPDRIYQIDAADTAAREDLDNQWGRLRASVGLALLELISGTDDETRLSVMQLWGYLEQLHEQHTRQLETSWLKTVAAAHECGRIEELALSTQLLREPNLQAN